MSKLLIILLFGMTVGCASHKFTTVEYSREIVLSNAHPEDDFIRARLVSIDADGTTTIYVIPSGRKLRAAVGDYFVSEEYGNIGLQLISASAEKHEAKLLRRSGG